MATSLTPRLAKLDERVLAVLDTWRGRRARHVAELLYGKRYWRCTECCREAPADGRSMMWCEGTPIVCLGCLDRERTARPGEWFTASEMARTLRPVLIASPEDTSMVREILRGLECLGHARQAGGWWRRAAG